MVFGNQSWDLPNWRLSSSPLPMIGREMKRGETLRFQEEGDDLPTLGSGERINGEGYITNAPKKLGDKDFIHRVVRANNNIQIHFDPALLNKCGEIRSNTYAEKTEDRTFGLTSKEVRDTELPKKIQYYENNSECDMSGNHYWVDTMAGIFSVGCNDVEADNYSAGTDYSDDSLCTYTCSDPNRGVNDDGSCAECNDGYGLNDDDVCQQGITDRFIGGITGLPWELMGAGAICLIIARFMWKSNG
jgi:hypothetical protein